MGSSKSNNTMQIQPSCIHMTNVFHYKTHAKLKWNESACFRLVMITTKNKNKQTNKQNKTKSNVWGPK